MTTYNKKKQGFRGAVKMGSATAGLLRRYAGKYLPKAVGKVAKTYAYKGVSSLLTRKVQKRTLPMGAGGQTSYFTHSGRISKKTRAFIKKLSPCYRFYTTGSRITSSAGAQATAQFPIFSGDLGGISGTGSSNDLAVIYAESDTANQSSKVFLKRGYTKFMMTNQDQGNVIITIYDIAVRNDATTTPSATWATGLGHMTVPSGKTAMSATDPGSTPFASQLFCRKYKVVNTTSLILGAGQTHNHIVSYKPNKFFDFEELTESTISKKGYTIWTLMVAHGAPYNDKTTTTNVSTGAVNIDVVQSRQLEYCYLPKSGRYGTTSNQLGAITIEEVMTVGGNSKVDDTPA